MPVLNTTSPSTSVSAPNERPMNTVPSSRTSAASRPLTFSPPAFVRVRSLAHLVYDLAADHRQADDAPQPLALERRIPALGVELTDIDRPLGARVDHHQVGRCADSE